MTDVKKRLTITLSENVIRNLEDLSKERGLSKSAIITIALSEMENNEKGKK